MSVTVHHGDMLEVLPTLGARFHAVITDPPYHLASIVKRFGADGAAAAKVGATGAYARASKGFMGKQWDGGDIAFRPETWAAVGSVMLPGAHLVAFAGTKGAHRMACAIEDAGFEIRDTLAWLYGSGFPKSHDVSKGIDKAAGAEREVIGPRPNVHSRGTHKLNEGWKRPWQDDPDAVMRSMSATAPATDAARAWEGWGTALKPAYEPIVLARWPMDRKTVAANVLAHGTGAINVEACRIGASKSVPASPRGPQDRIYGAYGSQTGTESGHNPNVGRWPANVVHDGSEEVIAAFPGQAGAGGQARGRSREGLSESVARGKMNGTGPAAAPYHGDSGSAARFFYSAKADKGDRLDSKHPTVKPVDLMRWLVRLVTPKGGLVLDPFAGSGTTGMACMAEGFDCHLIEREAEYAADIRRRIAHVSGADAPLFASAE